MNQKTSFHVLTVGWEPAVIAQLCDAIAAKSGDRFSHLVHPRYTAREWDENLPRAGIEFFRDALQQRMPAANPQMLASLEQEGVPTVHNMIMSDRIVSQLGYDAALRYATFLVQRMLAVFAAVEPSVIIGAFDGIHGSLALAVARRMNIPWFALSFSVIPPGRACFCDRMSPAARVQLGSRSAAELQSLAERSLQKFENRKIQVLAYVEPPPLPLAGKLSRLPQRWSALRRTLGRARLREFLQFTEERRAHSVAAALAHFRRTARARNAVTTIPMLTTPPATPYVLFGLHMQPESSIDVWAPFFSNQMRVIELLSRSIPPTHKLLVKIHKSDIANHSPGKLEQMRAFPGVELVAPFADSRSFIEQADLLTLIQGTMGLEAALLGKPVIMLGDSPIATFSSVSQIGAITDLPALVRSKLVEPRPSRTDIVNAYASYLAPLWPASLNDWTRRVGAEEIDGYVKLFAALKLYVAADPAAAQRVAL